MPAENGFVPTPEPVAERMAAELFVYAPDPDDRVLFPGLGTGRIYDAVRSYLDDQDLPVPELVGVEIDQERIEEFRESHPDDVEIHRADFLLDPPAGKFDYIVANPPYLRYSDIPKEKRDPYRKRFQAAVGQFDIYMPFIEQMLRLLKPGGYLVMLTPSKYMTIPAAETVRSLIRSETPQAFFLLPDGTFPNHTVRTVITALQKDPSPSMDKYLWLEGLYRGAFEKFLGLSYEESHDEWEAYGKAFRLEKRLVDTVDRRERGIHIVDEDGTRRIIREGGEERQANLGDYSHA